LLCEPVFAADRAEPPLNQPACANVEQSALTLFLVKIKIFHAKALKRTQGNKTRAAKLLHLSRATFLYRLEKHGLM